MKCKISLILYICIAILLFVSCAKQERSLTAKEGSINIEEQLSLGEKYLLELNYDNAIIAFNKVINVDPKNERAYIGLSDAYIGKGDIANAIEMLENGIEAIPDIAGNLEEKLKLLKLNTISFKDFIKMDSFYFDKCEEIIELFKSEKFEMIPEYIRNEVALPIRDSILNNSEKKIIYYGNIKDGKPQGLGVCVYSKGMKKNTEAYVGQFDKGVRSGTGLAIFTDYSSQGYYIGEWNEDNVHGSGALYEDSFYSEAQDAYPDGIYDQYSKGVTNNGSAEGYWLEGWYDDNGKIPTEDGSDTNGIKIAGYQYYCIGGHSTSMGKVSSQAWWVNPIYDEENIIGSNLMVKAYIVYDDGTEVFEEAPHEHAGGINCKICIKNHEGGNINSFHPWEEEVQPNRLIWFGFYIE